MNRWLIAVLLLNGCARPLPPPSGMPDICRMMCQSRMSPEECERLVYRKMQEKCYGR